MSVLSQRHMEIKFSFRVFKKNSKYLLHNNWIVIQNSLMIIKHLRLHLRTSYNLISLSHKIKMKT